MNKLPLELLTNILLMVPSSSSPAARLTCHAFNAILAPRMFQTLPTFLRDLDAAQEALMRIASKPSGRPRCIWSPYCAVPRDLEVQEGFLAALYTGLSGGYTWDAVRMGAISREAVVRALGWERKESDEKSEDVTEDESKREEDEGETEKRETIEADRHDDSNNKINDDLAQKLLDEKRLRIVQHKYSLYMSYVHGDMERYHRPDLLQPRFWLN